MNDTLRTTACWVAAAALMHSVPTIVRAEPTRLTHLAVEELKRAYLWCNSAAAMGRLRTVDIAQCSVLYEDLKNRAFQGDFERLLAWSRAQQLQRDND